ncbi:hypothetical protein [Turicimonas muris]|uniref:hypothetical protein n=1 Tax=Turicimonas muris TaxID=1796652 RepID=UPI00249470A3|nr:hypothetical protein [Turicimonas muris]
MKETNVSSKKISTETFCQQPLPYIFSINRLAITMTYMFQKDALPQSALTQKDLIEAMCTFAYRVPYSVVAAPDIKKRKSGVSALLPSIALIEEAVNSMLAIDIERIAAAEKKLLKYLPHFNSKDCWQAVLKYVFLNEFHKGVTDNIPLSKKLFALPKGHFQSLQDYVLKHREAPLSYQLAGGLTVPNKKLNLNGTVDEHLWMVASCRSYRLATRPMVKDFFEHLASKAETDTWDHDIFEMVFSEAITDAYGNKLALPKTTENWEKCIYKIAAKLKLFPSYITEREWIGEVQNDKEFQAENTPVACRQSGRKCHCKVIRFLCDIMTVFKWGRTNFSFCKRDSAVYTLYLTKHLAFWKLNFTRGAHKSLSFPIYESGENPRCVLLRPKRVCSFLMHLSPKYGSQKYLYWSFVNFAKNYLDDSELEKFSEIKAKGEQEETNDTKYSQYQGASGKHLTSFILNTPYHC